MRSNGENTIFLVPPSQAIVFQRPQCNKPPAKIPFLQFQDGSKLPPHIHMPLSSRHPLNSRLQIRVLPHSKIQFTTETSFLSSLRPLTTAVRRLDFADIIRFPKIITRTTMQLKKKERSPFNLR